MEIRRVTNDRGSALQAYIGDELVGHLVFLTPEPDVAQVLMLSVKEEHRREGIGTALSQAMRDLGFREIQTKHNADVASLLDKFWAGNGGPLADMQPLDTTATILGEAR